MRVAPAVVPDPTSRTELDGSPASVLWLRG
jgi:hypothetical protein